MIELIGGIEVEGRLRRDVTLKPLTGAAEMALAELAAADMAFPDKVTRFLQETLAEVGGAPADPAALSVGDRQYLVRQVGARLGMDRLWLGGDCPTCGEPFEIEVRQADLPVKRAGSDYPTATIALGDAQCGVRTPTGADQSAIADLPPEDAAMALLRRLVSGPDDIDLSDATRTTLEAAIEALSPEVALEVAAKCPDCGADVRLEVDPYLTLTQPGRDILDDVHVLARHYHWAEADILSLTSARRHAYLARIDLDRGMSSDPNAIEVP